MRHNRVLSTRPAQALLQAELLPLRAAPSDGHVRLQQSEQAGWRVPRQLELRRVGLAGDFAATSQHPAEQEEEDRAAEINQAEGSAFDLEKEVIHFVLTRSVSTF